MATWKKENIYCYNTNSFWFTFYSQKSQIYSYSMKKRNKCHKSYEQQNLLYVRVSGHGYFPPVWPLLRQNQRPHFKRHQTFIGLLNFVIIHIYWAKLCHQFQEENGGLETREDKWSFGPMDKFGFCRGKDTNYVSHFSFSEQSSTWAFWVAQSLDSTVNTHLKP